MSWFQIAMLIAGLVVMTGGWRIGTESWTEGMSWFGMAVAAAGFFLIVMTARSIGQ